MMAQISYDDLRVAFMAMAGVLMPVAFMLGLLVGWQTKDFLERWLWWLSHRQIKRSIVRFRAKRKLLEQNR